MSEKYDELEEYQGKEVEEKAYKYLKAKHDSDPETLTELEGGLLLFFSTSRYLSLVEKKKGLIKVYRNAFERAKTLVDTYAAGKYTGKDISHDFYDTMPSGMDQAVRLLGDIELLIEINELNERFLKINLQKEPLREITAFSQEEIKCINEEHAALVAAGFPPAKIDAEAKKRGTFKAAFGADHLPPIEV